MYSRLLVNFKNHAFVTPYFFDTAISWDSGDMCKAGVKTIKSHVSHAFKELILSLQYFGSFNHFASVFLAAGERIITCCSRASIFISVFYFYKNIFRIVKNVENPLDRSLTVIIWCLIRKEFSDQEFSRSCLHWHNFIYIWIFQLSSSTCMASIQPAGRFRPAKGNFMLILKENWNAAHLKFGIHLLNCIVDGGFSYFYLSAYWRVVKCRLFSIAALIWSSFVVESPPGHSRSSGLISVALKPTTYFYHYHTVLSAPSPEKEHMVLAAYVAFLPFRNK